MLTRDHKGPTLMLCGNIIWCIQDEGFYKLYAINPSEVVEMCADLLKRSAQKIYW